MSFSTQKTQDKEYAERATSVGSKGVIDIALEVTFTYVENDQGIKTIVPKSANVTTSIAGIPIKFNPVAYKFTAVININYPKKSSVLIQDAKGKLFD